MKETKMSKFEREIEKKRKSEKDFNFPEKMVVRGIKYIREDFAVEYANSVPEEVKENFLIKKATKHWYNPFSWFNKDEEFQPKGNMLFLMDNEGNLRIFDKVQSGYFKINSDGSRADDGRKEPNRLILKPNKLRTITFENPKTKEEIYWKCWVCDINNVNALPENPTYDCEDVSEVINRAVAGNKAFAMKDNGGSYKWVKWVFIGLAVLYVGYLAITRNMFGLGDIVGYGKVAVENVAMQNAENGATAVAGGTLG